MVEANEEGKQVEQEYGYHSYIQPGEYIAKLEGRTWYGCSKTTKWGCLPIVWSTWYATAC